MKFSVAKLIGLYSLLYALFTLGVLAWAVLTAVRGQFSWAGVGALMMTWTPHWWWLCIGGLLLHGLGYLRAMKRPRLMVAHLLCVWAFAAYPLVPNYSFYLALLQLVAVGMIMTYHRHVEIPGTEAV